MNITPILEDAAKRFSEIGPTLLPSDLEWHAWPQTWSDTACGRGGIGGQMISQSQIVVVLDQCSYLAYVYNGGFWKVLDLRNPKHMKAFQERNIR